MHTNRVYTIFWQPSSLPEGVSPFPASPDYRQVVDSYFERVAGDSHKSSNVYSVPTQYSEGATHIEYSTAFGGSVIDEDPFPANGCVDTVEEGGEEVTLPVCLTEKQLESEIAHVIEVNEVHGWSAGPDSVFFLYTPESVGSCFEEEEGPVCSYAFYCAYHGNFTSGGKEILFANMPYQVFEGCDDGARPEGSSAGPAIDTSSHENIEAITDPTEHGWWDHNGEPETNAYFGEEIADLCLPLEFTSSFAAEAYGPLLGGAYETPGAYNQAIEGHHYLLQREWSNAAGAPGVGGNTPGACQQLLLPVGFTPPSEPRATRQAAFDASASGTVEDPATSWHWNFGDGQTGEGERPNHTYAEAGNYTVTLTVTDAREDSNSTSLLVHVARAPAPEEEHTTSTTTTTSASGTVTATSTTASSTTTTATTSTVPPPAHIAGAELARMLGLPANAATLGGAGATVSLGRATCPPACALTASLYTNVRAGRRHHRLSRRTLIGSAHLTVAAGASAPITLTLNATGRALLRRAHRVVAQLILSATDQRGAITQLTRTLTLISPRRRAHHRHR